MRSNDWGVNTMAIQSKKRPARETKTRRGDTTVAIRRGPRPLRTSRGRRYNQCILGQSILAMPYLLVVRHAARTNHDPRCP